MSGVSQTIPNFHGGISEQPDYLKPLGKVKDALNVVPDLTYGLFKRLGAKRIGNENGTTGALTGVSTADCKWFHYYTNASEGAYLGQIDKDGNVKMWRCSDGAASNMTWGDITEATIKEALKTQSGFTDNQQNDLQTLTINDTTFVSQTQRFVEMDPTVSPQKIHKHYCFIELKKTENGRQYALDVSTPHSTPNNYWSATRLRVERGGPSTADIGSAGQGHCPHVGTRIHTAPAVANVAGDGLTQGNSKYISGRNLVFRLTVTGQQGPKPSANIVDEASDYTCTYTMKIDLLHGGYGWISEEKQYTTHDNVNTWYNGEKDFGGGHKGRDDINFGNPNDPRFDNSSDRSAGYTLVGAKYRIHIDDSEKYRAPAVSDKRGVRTVDGNGTVSYTSRRPHELAPGFIRPDPTPFDADTATSAGTILGGIKRSFDSSGELFNGWKEGGDSIASIAVPATGLSNNTGFAAGVIPTVTFSGGGGAGAAGRCVMIDDGTGGNTTTYAVQKIVITNPGWDYTSAPTISLSTGSIPSNALPATLTTETDYSGIKAEIIGNGIYLYSDTPFTANVLENDLMRVVTDTTNDVTNLPNQCKHGYLVKVTNSQNTADDDYWLKFIAYNQTDGPGQWVETLHPDMRFGFNRTRMPLIIQRTTTANQFIVDDFHWTDRVVGDNQTNPRPYFIETGSNPGKKYIHRVLYWRNRLVIATDSKLSLSAPNDIGNFWRESALRTGPNDAILIKSSQSYPSDLRQGVETNAGLVLFTENQQLLLTTDAETLTPENARLTPLSTYYSNPKIPPISLGTTLGFIDNSGRNSRFMEMGNIQSGAEPTVFDHSKSIPTLLPKDADLFQVSRDNNMIFIGKANSLDIYVYRWYQPGEQRQMSSWVRWKLPRKYKYFFVADDSLYVLDNDNFLQKIDLISSGESATVTQDSETWDIHLDNWVKVSISGGYSPPTNKTTFPASWLSSVNDVTAKLVVVDPVNGNYDECEIDGTNIRAPGNWSNQVDSVTITNGGSGYTSAPTVTFTGGNDAATHQAQATATITNGVVTAINITDPGYNYTGTPTIVFGSGSAQASAVVSDKRYIGYLYDMEVEFPKLYPYKNIGQNFVADVNSSLVIHRLKVAFGDIGAYTFELNRTGKSTYTDTYEVTHADAYIAGDVPYLSEAVKTIPVYDKNTNVTFKLKSSHPSPATLRSLAWEGDYTTKNYQRR